MKNIKSILTLWGVLCLGCAVVYLICALWAAGASNTHFASGPTGLGEWLGMGLSSLGLVRVIELLEKK